MPCVGRRARRFGGRGWLAVNDLLRPATPEGRPSAVLRLRRSPADVPPLSPLALAAPLRPATRDQLPGPVSHSEFALSPARHAPAILGCAAVLAAAAAGLAAAQSSAGRGPDAHVLDRLHAAAPVRAVRPAPAPAPTPAPRLHDATAVAAGGVGGSLYDSAVAAGASPKVVSDAVRLFARKLDFARDLKPGDGFRLVFDRTADAAGRTVSTGALVYAEIAAGGCTVRFYRFEHDGQADYLDGEGREGRPLLLRTPVDGARVTSGFGMRLHPILGFNRLHPGVDFGAPVGSPVRAAGDGVVEEAQWTGGYGHWLKLGHAEGYETGYGHLLRYAPGVRPGARVAQGQVVAFVGSTGLSTGPHLHFEIMHDGVKLDPAAAGAATAERGLGRAALAAFDAQKARVDGLLAQASAVRLARATPAGAPHAG